MPGGGLLPFEALKDAPLINLESQNILGVFMSERQKTGARKKVALHRRRESTPTLRLPQGQLVYGDPDRGRLRDVRRYRGCYLYPDRGRHTLVRG